MHAEKSTTSERKNLNVEIVEAVIKLTTNKGCKLKTENLSGLVDAYNKNELSMVYTTPFSSAEIFPGQTAYIVDIWYKHKKVYNLDYQCVDEVSDCRKRPKGVWLDQLMALAAT